MVTWVPLGLLALLLKRVLGVGPVTVQLFTREEVQEMVEVSPALTRSGFAVMETVGWLTVTVVVSEPVPAELVQVTV